MDSNETRLSLHPFVNLNGATAFVLSIKTSSESCYCVCFPEPTTRLGFRDSGIDSGIRTEVEWECCRYVHTMNFQKFSLHRRVFKWISRAAQWSEDENISIKYRSQMVVPECPTNSVRYSGRDSRGRVRTPWKITGVVSAWVIENVRSTCKWSWNANISCCISRMMLRYDWIQVCWNKVINVIMWSFAL